MEVSSSICCELLRRINVLEIVVSLKFYFYGLWNDECEKGESFVSSKSIEATILNQKSILNPKMVVS